MQGHQEVITHLNAVLKEQLTAINQYFLHARMYEDWGLEALNEQDYKASIRVMKHADKVIKRVLFLGGLPNLQDLGKLMVGENTVEMLANDLQTEGRQHSAMVAAIAVAEAQGDYVSRDLLEDLLEDSEAFIDDLETQQSLHAKLGEQNYLQSKI